MLLLEAIGTVVIPAATDKFVAKEKFKLKKEGGICSYLGVNFIKYFLSGEGKIEELIGEQTLFYTGLREMATDLPQKPGGVAIIPEIGGEVKATTFLTQMFSLMEKQKGGEVGFLSNNGQNNIFYIEDASGVLWAVYVWWRHDDGWIVNARTLEYSSWWHHGDQVFSPNSI